MSGKALRRAKSSGTSQREAVVRTGAEKTVELLPPTGHPGLDREGVPPAMLSTRSLTCLVAGNGAPVSISVAPVDICITFNGREPPFAAEWRLDAVSCRTVDPTISTIEIIGKGPEDFVDRLREAASRTACRYEVTLGCWPSTGFSILHALWKLDMAVHVRGICFDPALTRDGHANPRSAPPAMYHNWLGERRLSFARWLTESPAAWDWPMMQRSMALYPRSSRGLPYRDLLAVLASARQTRSLEDLANLLTVPLGADIEYISAKPSKIGALEQCFHLTRCVDETLNWWLYDERGAIILDKLAQHIRACQSALFAAALSRPTTPAG